MSSRLLSVFVAVTAVLCAAASARADDGDALPADEASAVFAWFDTLGLPSTAGLPFVRFTQGISVEQDDGSRNPVVGHGFLLSTDVASFVVLTPALDRQTVKRTPPGTPLHAAAATEPSDLVALATTVDSALAGQPVPGARGGYAELGEGVVSRYYGRRPAFLVLARACDRRGHPDLARRLLARCANERRRNERGRPLLDVLADDVARALLWELIDAFGRPEVPRSELLVAARRIVDVLPDAGPTKSAAQFAKRLEAMVAEDESHTAPADFPDVAADIAAREWIFRLRDQNGQQWSQPGSCSVFATPDHDDDTPAHHLTRLGYDAVPALIDALDDARLTRSVGFHRDFHFSHEVLTVGDAAAQVLYRISGQDLPNAESARAWWDEIQARGPEHVLAEAVRQGDLGSPAQARKLLEQFPEHALTALIAGARAGRDDRVRPALVDRIAEIDDPAATAFLQEELIDGPTIATRVAAADALFDRGQSDVVDTMIEEFRTTAPAYAFDELIRFLVECGQPRALDALSAAVDARAPHWRIQLLQALFIAQKDPRRTWSPEWDAAAESLLVARLADREARMGLSMRMHDISMTDPRVCDLAAAILVRRRQPPGAFDLAASSSARDRACIRLANTWRAQHGQPLLPEPSVPVISPIDAARTAPALAALRAASDDDARAAALDALVGLGLGALPAVEAALQTAPGDDPNLTRLQTAADRLALIVRAAEIEADGVDVPEHLRALLSPLVGAPVRAEYAVDILTSAVRALPSNASGFELVIERAEDGSGVALTLRYRPAAAGAASAGTGDGSCSYSGNVTRSGRALSSWSGASSTTHLQTADAWDSFADDLDRAFAARAREPIEVRVVITRAD